MARCFIMLVIKHIVLWYKPVGAGMAGTARAIPLFQDNNVIVFILQNLQHAGCVQLVLAGVKLVLASVLDVYSYCWLVCWMCTVSAG